MNYELPTTNSEKHRSGMALLSVLFIVFVVVVVSMGLLHRSDMALASGQNLCLRNQSDYLAWAGLEHARACIQSYGSVPSATSISVQSFELDTRNKCHYAVTVAVPSVSVTDPNVYTYPVTSEGWYGSEADKQARSSLTAAIAYDPNDGKAVFRSIRRQ
jgi:hypothetical protein